MSNPSPALLEPAPSDAKTLDAAPEPMTRPPRKLLQGSITFLAFLAVFAIYFLWLGETFTDSAARLLDVHQNAPVLLLGLAVMVTLIAGQFDLSVGSMATLTTFLAVGLPISQGWPFWLGLVACLAVGVIGGLINGLLVVRLQVNTFIATLGTGGVFLGLSSVYSSGTQISAVSGGNQLPTWFTGPDSFGAVGAHIPEPVAWLAFAGALIGIGMAARRLLPGVAARRADAAIAAAAAIVVVVFLVLPGLRSWVTDISWTIATVLLIGLVLWILLTRTTFGRYLQATGSNPEAARLSGVNPGKETMKAFVIGGVLAAIAGVLVAANQGAASPDVGVPFLLPAFAAAFLSTVVLSTGRFTVWGTLIGGTMLVWVAQGLIVGGLPFTWTAVVNGLVLIGAVAFSSAFRRE